MLRPIRLVTFDALYTLIVPRLPIHVQYSQTFEPYLGTLNPEFLKQAFKVAFRSLESEDPVYGKGSQAWWSEVIRRTALGAGANEQSVNIHLDRIVPKLLHRFSTKEGYRAFDDAIPILEYLRNELNIRTALISNTDSRIKLVFEDLGFPDSLDPMILSEQEGVEKPSPEIYLRALEAVNYKHQEKPIRIDECLHVGDEIDADYYGALAVGMKALLLRRTGEDGERGHRDQAELPKGMEVVEDLHAVKRWVENYNDNVS